MLNNGLFSKKNKHLLQSQEGQSTVEFALTIILLLAFVLFYFQLSMIFAFGNYVHYATFMAARAYQSGGNSEEDQRARAKSVIVRLLKKSEGQAGVDKFPTIAKGVGEGDPRGFVVDRPSQFNKDDENYSWMEGVRYTFRGKLFLIPLGGTGKGGKDDTSPQGSVNSVTLTSESWLGREPTDSECRGDMGKDGWFFDNGC